MTPPMKFFRFPVLALMLLLAACATATSTDVPVGDAVVVELDAFSGLPNPTWTLSAADAVELERRLRDLPAAPSATLPDAGLGYRGFRLTTTVGKAPRRIYVTGGLVQVGDDHPLYRDVHGLEAWLQAQARRQGYGGVLPSANP
jgi:hypothetical protein